MPDPTIRIVIHFVVFTRRGRAVGTGQGTIRATADSGAGTTAIGDATRISNYRRDRRVTCEWSADINVRGRQSVTLTVACADQAGTRVSDFEYRLTDPWRLFEHEVLSTENAHLVWSVRPGFGIAQRRLAPYAVAASRNHHGSIGYTTVTGQRGEFRLETCPIRPVPPDLQLPPRPLIATFEILTGNRHPWRNGLGRDVRADDPINVLPNPAVIPVLDPPAPPGDDAPTPEELDNATTANQRNAARLECSFYWPESQQFTDNDSRLEWRKISGAGDVAFIKYRTADRNGTENKGLKVMAYGTAEGEIVLGVYLNNTVVTRLRALVHPIQRIPCRFNILNGPAGPAHEPMRYTPPSTPAHVTAHRKIANRFLRQAGLVLAPDTNNTLAWANGRTVTRTDQPGVFRIRVHRNETRGVSDDDSEDFIRYNWRRGTLNFIYIHSHASAGTGGAAIFWPHSKMGNAAGTINDTGTPSSSWIRPSGMPPDQNAGTVRMRYIRGWPPPNNPATRDLYGMLIASGMGADPGGIDAMDYGCAVAHEVGHMLNLGHRVETIANAGLRTQWNAGTLAPAPNAGGRIPALQQGAGNLGADDGVWCDELWYPRLQNVMRWTGEAFFTQTFDILQARVIQQSPLLDLA